MGSRALAPWPSRLSVLHPTLHHPKKSRKSSLRVIPCPGITPSFVSSLQQCALLLKAGRPFSVGVSLPGGHSDSFWVFSLGGCGQLTRGLVTQGPARVSSRPSFSLSFVNQWSRAASGGSRMPAQPPLLPVFAPVTETPARERTLAHLHPSGPARSKKTSLTVSGPKGTGRECEQRLIYPTSPARGTDGPASQTSVPRSEWRDSNGA